MLDLCQRNWRYRNATTDQIDNVFIEIFSEGNDRSWPTTVVQKITAYVCKRCIKAVYQALVYVRFVRQLNHLAE